MKYPVKDNKAVYSESYVHDKLLSEILEMNILISQIFVSENMANFVALTNWKKLFYLLIF